MGARLELTFFIFVVGDEGWRGRGRAEERGLRLGFLFLLTVRGFIFLLEGPAARRLKPKRLALAWLFVWRLPPENIKPSRTPEVPDVE